MPGKRGIDDESVLYPLSQTNNRLTDEAQQGRNKGDNMKINGRKEEFWKSYNLHGKAVPVIGYGYRMDYYTDEDGTPFKAYLENDNGWWYATDWATGLKINTCGYKTRKACAAFVEEVANKLHQKVLEYLQGHVNVYDLGVPMTQEEFYRAVRAGMSTATDEPTEEAAEPEPTSEPVETTETEVTCPESRYNEFMEKMSKSETLEDLKRVYSDEYSEVMYDVDLLKDLDLAYEYNFDAVRCLHRTKGGKVYSTESAANHETVGFFPEFVGAISNMADVWFTIEGTWMWVSGNTKPHREELKRLGLRWAPKRKMWYKKPAEKCPAAV